MDINHLVEQVKAGAGEQLTDAEAKVLIRIVFAEIIKSVEAGSGEPVRVPGLGVFKTHNVEREKDGVKTLVRKTIFAPKASN